MHRLVTNGIMIAALVSTVAAQDWYHEREERYRGNWQFQDQHNHRS